MCTRTPNWSFTNIIIISINQARSEQEAEDGGGGGVGGGGGEEAE